MNNKKHNSISFFQNIFLNKNDKSLKLFNVSNNKINNADNSKKIFENSIFDILNDLVIDNSNFKINLHNRNNITNNKKNVIYFNLNEHNNIEELLQKSNTIEFSLLNDEDFKNKTITQQNQKDDETNEIDINNTLNIPML